MQPAPNMTLHLADTAAWCAEQIKALIARFGPRAPGSPAEWDAQQAMAEQLRPWADTVETEGFPVHRQAFMGFIPFTVLLTMAACGLFWFGRPVAGLTLVTLAALPLVLEFAMYRQFIDRLFKAYPSHNVVARRKPAGEIKKRIYLVGHADSQYEWTLNYRLGGVGMKLVLIPAVVGMVICFCANLLRFLLFDIAALPNEGFLYWLFKITGIVLFCLFPCDVGFLFFQSRRRGVPGANDNLSGCYTAMAILKEMREGQISFEDTEVVVLLTGSEEAGLRGAKAYVERHKAELHDPAIETVAVGLDTFRDLKDIAIYNRDLSGTVRHSPKMQRLMWEAGKRCGYDLPSASIYIGACDAVAFTQAGIPATGFAAMDPTPPRWYHTRLDNAERLEPKAIEVGAAIALEAVRLFAGFGLALPDGTAEAESMTASGATT
ncbi:MAG: Zn-dependent exopeptidase M28 [Oscillospiraceae bacterium]|nr:Zn-dependent exopeptidase M28 [Oscillospiraceae bacterium]